MRRCLIILQRERSNMRNKLIYFLLAMPFLAFGQSGDYETINNQNKELAAAYGKKSPGYYITKDGTRTDCLVLFEEGGELNFYESPLATSMSYAGESQFVEKRELAAFFVNKRLYVPATILDRPQWVRVKYQGAIQRYYRAAYMSESTDEEIVFTYDEEKQTNVAKMETSKVYEGYWTETDNIQKLDEEPESPILITKKVVMIYVVDNDDLWTKIKNKEKGYKQSLAMVPGAESFPDKMFGIYNKWYDENNAGAITYYPQFTTYKSPDSPTSSSGTSAAVSAAEKAVVEEVGKAHFEARKDPFEGRPAVAGAAVASAKPEVAVKKESFMDRLNRIKSDGNKVGVLVTGNILTINPGSVSEGTTKAQVRGSYPTLEGLDDLAKTTAEQLNAGFSVDVFEAVDYSQIPVKEGKYGKMDDWWSTKYKVIVMYEIMPKYTAYYKTIDSGTLEREFQAKMHVHGEMIVMSAEDAKPDKLKYVTSSPKTWGYYNSEMFKASAETELNTIQELKAVINPPADDVIIEALIKSQKESLDKFVKKKSK